VFYEEIEPNLVRGPKPSKGEVALQKTVLIDDKNITRSSVRVSTPVPKQVTKIKPESSRCWGI
jgi:hypothetical protein